jgi:hypothetical protein
MWKTISGWIMAFFGMAKELEEHRISIRQLEDRLRDHEEALKLVAQELRFVRELEASEREKQLFKLEREIARLKELPRLKGKKK